MKNTVETKVRAYLVELRRGELERLYEELQVVYDYMELSEDQVDVEYLNDIGDTLNLLQGLKDTGDLETALVDYVWQLDAEDKEGMFESFAKRSLFRLKYAVEDVFSNKDIKRLEHALLSLMDNLLNIVLTSFE